MAEAELDVYVGPMFSGKTDALIARYRSAPSGGAVVLKPTLDGRHPADVLVSHGGDSVPATSGTGVADVDFASSTQILLIDEIQFFDPSILRSVSVLRARGVAVVAAGLDLDFAGRRFETTQAFVELATHVTALQGRCAICGRPATHTERLVAGAPAPPDSPRIEVGGAEVYSPRCYDCWSRERRHFTCT